MPKVIVTGGTGKAGRVAVKDLIDHGYEVAVVDAVPWKDVPYPCLVADLTDFGQTIDALTGFDAVVHLAAIPAPRMHPDAATFANNIQSTYNVFEAARRLGIKNIVWASSETVLGLPFDTPPPYVPLDEEYVGRPETAYSLSKWLGEKMAEQFCRWDPALKIIGLRFSNVMLPEDYERFPSFDRDSNLRKWNLWAYIDARDAAQAIRKALEARITGAEVFVIANDDSVMSRSNAELLAEIFPGVPVKRAFGPNESLLSSAKAKRLLDFQPEHGWR